MIYICEECGKVFEEDEICTWQESRGEFWGAPCSEEMEGCPHCKGSFVKAKECKVCGKWIKDDDWDVCDDCLDKHKTSDNCFEIGKEYPEKIEINGFLGFAFTVEEIESILTERLKGDEEKIKKLAFEYCEEDIPYFVDWVVQKCQKKK